MGGNFSSFYCEYNCYASQMVDVSVSSLGTDMDRPAVWGASVLHRTKPKEKKKRAKKGGGPRRTGRCTRKGARHSDDQNPLSRKLL